MGSVLKTRHLSRCNESSFLLLSLPALCCVRRWQGSPNCFLSARAPPPPPCRLPSSVMRPRLQGHPPALDGRRGEPSPWTGWNPKEQFSRPRSRGKVPPLLDHHHLHLHLHLLHNHLLSVKRTLHTGRRSPMCTSWLDLNL